MREARIILPKATDLDGCHRALRRELAGRFGGYTATDSYGGWIAPNGELVEEPGIAYDVATDDGAETRGALREIATRFGRMAHQQAMYLRQPDGTVDILDTSVPPAANDRVAA